MSPADPVVRVLFVCLGNICRSPTAHGVLRARLKAAGLGRQVHIESAGTGDWHVGKAPDSRAQSVARSRGFDISDLRARQVVSEDLQRFDYVLAMDPPNLDALERLAEATTGVCAHIALFGDFSAHYHGEAVPDPYFGGDQGFEHVLDMIEDASEGLLHALRDLMQNGH